MGFETEHLYLDMLFLNVILKHSLWDLKLFDLLEILSCYRFWSTPYGIWNYLLLFRFSLLLIFWSTPYGIWNNSEIEALKKYKNFEALPMGFETISY